jgi:hypothetical protein
VVRIVLGLVIGWLTTGRGAAIALGIGLAVALGIAFSWARRRSGRK